MLTTHKLGLSINDYVVFSNISITFLPSSITYLVGLNGSGKTSLLRSIAGIQQPSHGEVLFGKNQLPAKLVSKPFCVYIGHNNAIKNELTVLENLKLWSKFYNSYETIDAALYYFKLNQIAHTKCYELSAGNKQKVALARLLACNSNIWLLDEVDQNLDKNNQELLDKLIISKADSGGIIIMTTHEKPRITSANILNIHDYE